VSRVVDALATHAPEGYDVGIECTHHGPTDTAVPSLFVEVGSAEPQWADPAAAGAVARAVFDLRGTGPDLVGSDGRPRHIVGFGGGHYAPRFTRIVRETAWTVGHVAADWGLGEMGAPDANRDVLAAAFERSDATHAVIEGDRPDLVETVEALGHRVVSETWVRAVGDRPLALVEALEASITPVSEGLRFGSVVPDLGGEDPHDGDDPDSRSDPLDAVSVRELPEELLARAQGIDGDADGDGDGDTATDDPARTAVETNAVAFETEQGGTRAVGRAAFATGDVTPDYDDLVADLAAVLATAYDEVEIDWGGDGDDGGNDDGGNDDAGDGDDGGNDDAGDRDDGGNDDDAGDDAAAVIARETAFDPERAAIRGVPEGPAFGKLASGEPVEIRGETVRPVEVSRETEERFPIDST